MLRDADAARVEALYRRYGGLLYRRCLALLEDPGEARAALQEVFVRMMGRLEQEEQVGSPRTYLFRAATNCCLNRLRDRKPIDEVALDELESPSAADPASLVGNRRTAAACLSLLNEEERLLMWLHFVEGLTQEEVAEVAGLSRKTVNERLGLIRRRLSDWLSAPGARHA